MKKALLSLQVPLFYLFAYLPTSIRRWLARVLAKQLNKRPNTYRHRIKVNLEVLMPHLSHQQREQYITEHLHFLLDLFLQAPRVLLRERNSIVKRIKQVKGREIVSAAHKQNKGVIFLLPHLGNWEVLAPYLGREFQCTALYKPLNHPHLDGLLRRYRSENGMKLVPVGKTGVRHLLMALKRKESIIILPDQNPARNTAQQVVSFFGIDLPLPSLLAQLCTRTEAPVVAVFAVRTSRDEYQVEFHKPPQPIYSKDERQSVQAIAACVEYCVRQYPAQYQWYYRMLHRTKYRRLYDDLSSTGLQEPE